MPASSSSFRKLTTRLPVVDAAPAKPLPVADLVRRLAEAEARLRAVDAERAGDAELIGNLLAEVADRDRRLQHLEGELTRARGVLGDVLRALSERHDPNAGATDDLGELLDAALGAAELTRSATTFTVGKLDEARTALEALPEIEQGLEVTQTVARRAHDAVDPIDRAVLRVAERLREVERRERELGELRTALQDDARALLGGVTSLRGALAPLAADDEPRPAAARRKPSRLPTKRR